MQFSTQFYNPRQWGNVRDMRGWIGGRNTAVRTSGHGVICCLETFLAETEVLAWLTDITTVQ